MSFAGQVLFENVNAVFNSGERYGLTGLMGAANQHL